MNRRTFLKTAGLGVAAAASSGLGFFYDEPRGGTLPRFSTPAGLQDLGGADQARFNDLWHANLEALTRQAICGNPWNRTGTSSQTYYFDPTRASLPPGTAGALVSWGAFPNRLNQYFGTPAALPENPYKLPQNSIWELADCGFYTDPMGKRRTFPSIPQKLCPQADWNAELHPIGPYGPRGWQDEYCEWIVARNAQGKIVRVDFTCENPEYWHTLWRVNPGKVAQLYQQVLNFGLPSGSPGAVTVAVEDLQLTDPVSGKPVIDPSTGAPAYNPLNRWNRGTATVRGGADASGGAIHLIATPNTLQAQMVSLAGAATILRANGNADSERLNCCSQYGQAYRNSDPHLGQIINQAVASGPQGSRVSLADPVGLYMQMPYFGGYVLPHDPNLPKGASAADCWRIVRGGETLLDRGGQQPFPGNFILHAVFQIPAAWVEAGVSFTVGDIAIKHNGVAMPIQYGAQIAETLQIGLFAWKIPASAPEPLQACVADLPKPLAQPVQLIYEDVWKACRGAIVENPLNVPMTLASNLVIVPARVVQGAAGLSMALICQTAARGPKGELPTVTSPDSGLKIAVVDMTEVTHVISGHSYPDTFQVLSLKVDVPRNTQPGLKDLLVTNFGQSPGMPAPAFWDVLPANG